MGLILNWNSDYPTTIDDTITNFPALVDGTHDVMASHPNELAAAIIQLETVLGGFRTTPLADPLSPSNGDVLTYNSGTGEWEAGAGVGGVTLQTAYEADNSVDVSVAQGTLSLFGVENTTIFHTRNTFVGGSGSAIIHRLEMGTTYTGWGLRIEQGGNGGIPFIVRTSAPGDGFVIGPLGHAYSAGSNEGAPTWSSPGDQTTGVILPGGSIYAIGCNSKEQVRFGASGSVIHGSTATAAVAITPTHQIIGGDGVAGPNDDLVRWGRIYDTVNETYTLKTERNRASGGYTEIGTDLHLGTAGSTAARDQSIFFNAGTGGAARQSEILGSGSDGYLRFLAPVAMDFLVASVIRMEFDANTTMCPAGTRDVHIGRSGSTVNTAARILLNSADGATPRQSVVEGKTNGRLTLNAAASTLELQTAGSNRVTVSSAGAIIVPTGSVSAVALGLGNESDTGLWRPAAGQVAIAGAGVELAAFTSTGVTLMGGASGTRVANVGLPASTASATADVILRSGNGGTARASGIRGETTGPLTLTSEILLQFAIGTYGSGTVQASIDSSQMKFAADGSAAGPKIARSTGTEGIFFGTTFVSLSANQVERIRASGDSSLTKMGTGSGFADIIGKAHSNITPVGNVTTGEDDLMTYTLPGNSLDTNGRGVRITAHFKTANNANSKTIKLYFGATEIARFSKSTADKIIKIDATVLRTGATTQISESETTDGTNNAAADSTFLAEAGPNETLSGNIVIKATGEATSTDDIIQQSMVVEYFG